MKTPLALTAGLLCVFIAAGLILPALAKVRDFGSMPAEVVGFYTLGILLAVAGTGVVALAAVARVRRRSHDLRQ